jgi:hypothetical protein
MIVAMKHAGAPLFNFNFTALATIKAQAKA